MIPKVRALLLLILVVAGPPARADDFVATLTLDGLSFISFGSREVLTIPAGSTLKFRFGSPVADGSVPFRVSPGDVAVQPIPLRGQTGSIRYTLSEASNGTLRKGPDGRLIIDLSATVHSNLEGGLEGGGKRSYSLRFSTEHAEAKSSDARVTLPIDGMRVEPGPNYVQLVAGTTNANDSIVEPGAAVYSVLSGTFDHLPTLR